MLPVVDSGVNRRLVEEKGRVSRWSIVFMVGRVTIAIRKTRNFAIGFSLNDVVVNTTQELIARQLNI